MTLSDENRMDNVGGVWVPANQSPAFVSPVSEHRLVIGIHKTSNGQEGGRHGMIDSSGNQIREHECWQRERKVWGSVEVNVYGGQPMGWGWPLSFFFIN